MKTIKTLNREEFERAIPCGYGDTTFFILDEPNNRYNYVSSIIDDIFDNENMPKDGYSIEPIADYPEVAEEMYKNFVAEMCPAEGVEDEGFEDIKGRFERKEAHLGIWKQGEMTIYMFLWA